MVVLSKSNTSMSLYKILFFFILLKFLSFSTSEGQDADSPVYLYQNCSTNRTTANSTFFHHRTLLSSLSSNAKGDTQFYNTTVRGENSSESVYGLFMCRGDIPSQLCQQCIVNATERLSLQCSLSEQAVIWYEECMVRYSNRSFFSTVDTRPRVAVLNTANISSQESFMRLLFSTVNETADEAANHPIGKKKYATKEAPTSELQSLYCLAQCTPDLSPHDCRTCLSGVIGDLPWCCEGKQGGRVLYPSCNIRYELFPFYRTSPTPDAPVFVPATNTFEADSRFTEHPIYLSHNCSSNETADSYFQADLGVLLSYLSSNATSGKKLFYKTSVPETVYGLFMCRGDMPSILCGQCVLNASNRIFSECHLFQEAIIWYSQCLLRYSSSYFFSEVDKSPHFSKLNITGAFSPIPEQNYFTSTLSNTLATLAKAAGDTVERYDTRSLRLNDLQILYSLAQCTPDLSSDDCKGCLGDVIGTAIPWSRLGSVGGRVLYPSCNLRFELRQFYMDDDQAQPPTPGSSPSQPRPTEKKHGRSRTIILIVVPTFVSVLFFLFGCYVLKRKARKSHKTILRENFGHESATLEQLQFDLAVIKAATNNFSGENMIGKGGFGEVYKGILLDGRQIAVKRLSRSSKQGVNEFKNEALLIAKLQHRNIVEFIGFCVDEQEKMLIYEYVPNKSLDYFLFDSHRQKLLSWFERYNIIQGIARGIHYLHEHSRLKIIHRDLKPSNVLLDGNMIPKISDFGLARIVEIHEDHESTNKIIGTYGYMSPEYAMFGEFSEKSDVFSFGVMVLEIVTGKKNLGSYESQRAAGGLLSYVWRQWKDQTPLSILDSNFKENYSEIEISKCIQIGLLCVQQDPNARPTMATVVLYLSSDFIGLPTPQEPAFLLHNEMGLKSSADESCSGQSVNNPKPYSINEMSITEFSPR